jgi:hypothetical protein
VPSAKRTCAFCLPARVTIELEVQILSTAFLRTILFASLPIVCLAQYKAEPAGAPPAELAPGVAAVLQKEGTKVVDGSGKTIAEVWLRADAPSGPATSEDMVTFTNVPQGSLMGAIKYAEQRPDRRGTNIKPGVYTLRFSLFPQNGNHQGVEPQRDFLLLTPAADDKDPKATPNFETLVAWSQKASGAPHAAVLSIWKQDSGFEPGLSQMGENDWVLQAKVGDLPLALILIGQTAH